MSAGFQSSSNPFKQYSNNLLFDDLRNGYTRIKVYTILTPTLFKSANSIIILKQQQKNNSKPDFISTNHDKGTSCWIKRAGFKGRRERALTWRNYIFSSPLHTHCIYFPSFNLRRRHSNQY